MAKPGNTYVVLATYLGRVFGIPPMHNLSKAKRIGEEMWRKGCAVSIIRSKGVPLDPTFKIRPSGKRGVKGKLYGNNIRWVKRTKRSETHLEE